MRRPDRPGAGRSDRDGLAGQDPRLRVLLVEDDRDFADFVGMAFATGPEPIALEVARDLGSALERLRGGYFDAVVLDLNLPDSRGIGTLQPVLETAPHAAVVVLTGVADADLARDALRTGAEDWLVKGQHDADALLRALRYAVERKRLTDGLLEAQKLDVAGRLATGVAHEFNNVLTAILGSAQLVEVATDDVARADAVQVLRRAARQGAALSRQLLSLARNPPSNAAVVSAASLVDNAVALVQAILPSSIALDVGPLADVDVELDAGQFDQMILNLVFNARDAMPDGGTLRISVDAERRGSGGSEAVDDRMFAVVRVIDGGQGIEADVLPRLFEPFFTTKGWRGTGLGLAVTAEIVDRFGGSIEVESQVGSGTTFSVWLPAVATMPRAGERAS